MAEIAASESNLPGDMSSSAASEIRDSHKLFTTASCRRFLMWCIPEVRRQGSIRGGDGGAFRIAENSSSAQ